MALLIDETAREIAFKCWALPKCLHVPIAAVNEDAISNYVGNVDRVVSGRGSRRALLVTVPERAKIDSLLPIGDHPNVGISTPASRCGFTSRINPTAPPTRGRFRIKISTA